MKKVLLTALLLLLVLSGAANASDNQTNNATTIKVEKGMTLWQISKIVTGSGESWKVIQVLNDIPDPRKLQIGKILIVPTNSNKDEFGKKLVKVIEKNYSKKSSVGTNKKTIRGLPAYGKEQFGRDPLMANSSYSGITTSARLLIDPNIKFVIVESQSIEKLTDNQTITMLFGRSGQPKIKKFVTDLDNETVDVELFLIKDIASGNRYFIYRNPFCGNFFLWDKPEEFPETEILEPIVSENPIVQVSKCNMCFENEPIVGAGAWSNDLARGKFAYGEYILWLKKCDSQYAFGAGVYGTLEDGDSEVSDYKWRGHSFGPQIGVKRSWFYLDKAGETRLQQWVVKLRLVKEHTHGDNRESGYEVDQHNVKAGLYAEYVREFNDKWLGMITIEGWHAFHKEMRSTWSGDSPASRTYGNIGLYAQYRIADNWQLRFGGGPFYQRWDRMGGIHLRAELRAYETIMVGPYVNFFPFRLSDQYREGGYSKSDLTTWGAFIRVEAGTIFRKIDKKRRMNEIKRLDYEELGIEEEVDKI